MNTSTQLFVIWMNFMFFFNLSLTANNGIIFTNNFWKFIYLKNWASQILNVSVLDVFGLTIEFLNIINWFLFNILIWNFSIRMFLVDTGIFILHNNISFFDLLHHIKLSLNLFLLWIFYAYFLNVFKIIYIFDLINL